jgi:predicted TIM-barrel fold metal-dependent hydrolase
MTRSDAPFWETASIDYPIIDADAHVNEPPDLWQQRVPSKYRARAPKVLKTDDGDHWSFDDGKRIRPLGLTATAGRNVVEFRPSGRTYEDIRPGSFDMRARLEDMDIDGIHAQVLYPSVTLTGAATYADERELQLACVRAYNEWMLEFCEGSHGRLIPQAIIPTTGVKDALGELRWALDHGHRGAIVSAYPNGSLESNPEDAAFWDDAAQSGTPVAIHIGSFTPSTAGGRHPDYDSREFLAGAGATKAGWNAMATTSDLLFSGVFERHPTLRVVLVESNIGWIPTFLEQTDDMFRRYRFFSKALHEMKGMPSDIFFRNFHATFMMDTVGIENRHRLEVDHLMFSTDYPHSGCDWPQTRNVIEKIFRGVPRDEVKKMLCDNARALYGLDDLPERL